MAKPTRRQFLIGCSAAAAAALIPAGSQAANRRLVSLENISFGAFCQSLNTIFTVRDNVRSVATMRLVEATLLPHLQQTASPSEDVMNEKFSLRFVGAPDCAVPQDTYWFEHPRLGRFPIFVVPVGPANAEIACYEAVFNRPSPALRFPKAAAPSRSF